MSKPKTFSVTDVKKWCKQFSFGVFGISERYDPKKMQENVKVYHLLNFIREGVKKETESKRKRKGIRHYNSSENKNAIEAMDDRELDAIILQKLKENR